jgi:kynureninase
MAFSFLISQLDSIPSLDGMDKVISTIHWRAQKQYEEDVIHFTADTYGALAVDAPHEASFTPYDEVTKEMVEGWLESGLDCEAIEANLDAQIENFLNPPIVAYPLPWNAVTAAPVVVVEETPAEPAAETTTEEEVIPE